MFNRAILFTTVLAVSAAAFVACSEDSTSKVNGGNPFNPGGGSDSGSPTDNTDGGPGTTDGGCPNKPAGCFCGTPTTQQQWLNRCTNSAALPVNLTVKAATTADIP